MQEEILIGGELITTGSHEEIEYLFYEFPEGKPPRKGDKPGQIKVFDRSRSAPHHRRVAFVDLPTLELKRTFVMLTGRTPEELGLGTGAW